MSLSLAVVGVCTSSPSACVAISPLIGAAVATAAATTAGTTRDVDSTACSALPATLTAENNPSSHQKNATVADATGTPDARRRDSDSDSSLNDRAVDEHGSDPGESAVLAGHGGELVDNGEGPDERARRDDKSHRKRDVLCIDAAHHARLRVGHRWATAASLRVLQPVWLAQKRQRNR